MSLSVTQEWEGCGGRKARHVGNRRSGIPAHPLTRPPSSRGLGLSPQGVRRDGDLA